MCYGSLLLLLICKGSQCGGVERQDATFKDQPSPLKVLFIGNSYTYYHRMPDIVAAMSSRPESPRRFEVRMVAQGGASLAQHWDGGGRRALRSGAWDAVVLQDQSTLPLTNPDRIGRYAERLAGTAREAGARTILYVTWARRDRPETQHDIDEAYAAAARQANAALAPVGTAWKRVRERWPDLALHDADGGHPSAMGSYLAACVLYISLQPGARECPALGDADRDDLAFARLRMVASEVMGEVVAHRP